VIGKTVSHYKIVSKLGMLSVCLVVSFLASVFLLAAEYTKPVMEVRELRLHGALDDARMLAEAKLGLVVGDARCEIELRLELARIHDRIGLHQNTRPVAAAFAQIEAADSVARRAGMLPSPEIELAQADYYYRAEMSEREFPTATEHTQSAIDLFRRSSDGHGEADAVHRLGLIHMQRGELEQARELFDESLDLDQADGERTLFRGEYERHVGFLYVLSDDTETSIPYFERSLLLRREAGAIDASLFAARTLAWALVEVGRFEQAKLHLIYAMTVAEHIGSPVGKARCGLVLGRLHESEGDDLGAWIAWEATIKTAESIGSTSIANSAKNALEELPRQTSPYPQSNSTTEVRNAVSALGRAFAKADVATLQTLLAQGYVHVNGGSGSVLDRDEWLSWITSRRAELDSGQLFIDTYSVEDVEIEVYGNVSVVTGVVYSTGQRNGASFVSRIRFTNGWIKSGDTWRRAAFHDSPLPKR